MRFDAGVFQIGVRPGDIDDQEIFIEIAGLGDDPAGAIEDDAVAVEDQFVVAADLVDIGQRAIPSPSLGAKQRQAKIVFAQHEGAGAGVDQDGGAGGAELGDGVLMI